MIRLRFCCDGFGYTVLSIHRSERQTYMYLDKGAVIGSGIVMLVFGIVFLVFPAFTLSFLAIMMGIAFLFNGISMLVSWWRGIRGSVLGIASAVMGALCIIFALICFIHPFAVASTLTWLVALCVVIAGVAQLIALLAAKELPGRGLGIIATIIVALFGIFALIWPPMVIQFLGISLVIEGISALILGIVSDSAR